MYLPFKRVLSEERKRDLSRQFLCFIQIYHTDQLTIIHLVVCMCGDSCLVPLSYQRNHWPLQQPSGAHIESVLASKPV